MGETIKVRVLVSVDETGNWGACGWKHAEWGDVIDGSAGVLEGAQQRHFWVTAELPLPERVPPEVPAQGSTEVFPDD